MSYEIIIYRTEDGKEPFNIWLGDLESKDQVRIVQRLDRIRSGNFGDHKSVGSSVYELRFIYGGGYRVYYGIKDNKIVVLLCGGNKKAQNKDIESAKQYWSDYNESL